MNRFVLIAAMTMFASAHSEASDAPPKLKQTIPLPGVEGRFDHAAYDPATHRLLFAALGNNTVEVVDVAAGKRLHSITGLHKPTGILYLPGPKLIVVANGDDGTCRFYDGATYAERGRIGGLDDADNLRFDPKSNRIYVGYGEGAIGVIDPSTQKLLASTRLPKHPEAFALEAKGPRIFVNVPDANQVAVIDRSAGKVVQSCPLGSFKANFPMALVEEKHLLLLGCREPARLVALNTQTGERATDAEMSGDVDDMFVDASGNRLFASCGEGAIDVFRIDSAGTLTRTHRIPTAAGARTALFDPTLGALILAVPHRGAQAAELRVYSVE